MVLMNLFMDKTREPDLRIKQGKSSQIHLLREQLDGFRSIRVVCNDAGFSLSCHFSDACSVVSGGREVLMHICPCLCDALGPSWHL